jgi:hypothetical protein
VHHPRHNSASLEARLGNPSPTCFQAKQAARSRCVSCAVFILPLILWCKWWIKAHLVLRPKRKNRHGDFVCQITKPQLPVFRPKPENLSEWFWYQTIRTVATGFEAKPEETTDLGFEPEPRNSCSLSPCAQCRPHTASPNLSIIRPPSTQLVLDHPRSSTPSLLLRPRSSSLPAMLHLSPTHHETSKHVSPHKIDSRIESPKFSRSKFKQRQVNY